MSDVELVRVVRMIKNVVRYGRKARPENMSDEERAKTLFESGNMYVFVNGQPVITIHYVHGVVDNGGQWRLAERIAREFGYDGPSVEEYVTQETLEADWKLFNSRFGDA